MRTAKAFILLTLAPGLIYCAGCGGGPKSVSVEGTVRLDGKPLSGVHVNFFPTGVGINDPTLFRGVTDAEGRYALSSPIHDRTGATPGKYRVTLTTAVAGPNDNETTPLPPERIPAKHRETMFEVPDDGTNDANFELKSR